MENIELDKEEFVKQYKKESEESGAVLRIYLNEIKPEEFTKNSPLTPITEIMASDPLTFAGLIIATENTIKAFKEKPEVEQAYHLLKASTRTGEKIIIKGEED